MRPILVVVALLGALAARPASAAIVQWHLAGTIASIGVGGGYEGEPIEPPPFFSVGAPVTIRLWVDTSAVNHCATMRPGSETFAGFYFAITQTQINISDRTYAGGPIGAIEINAPQGYCYPAPVPGQWPRSGGWAWSVNPSVPLQGPLFLNDQWGSFDAIGFDVGWDMQGPALPTTIPLSANARLWTLRDFALVSITSASITAPA